MAREKEIVGDGGKEMEMGHLEAKFTSCFIGTHTKADMVTHSHTHWPAKDLLILSLYLHSHNRSFHS